MAYATTTVSVSRSQEVIRALLRRAGADRIVMGEVLTGDKKSGAVEFVHYDVRVRVIAVVKEPSAQKLTDKTYRSQKSRKQLYDEAIEQESRRVWRVLHWALKTRMEGVDEGLETFEQAFLPHIVDPKTNVTLWETIRPMVESGALAVDGGTGLQSFTRALESGK